MVKIKSGIIEEGGKSRELGMILAGLTFIFIKFVILLSKILSILVES